MTELELNEKTVIELRKIAKENHVKLGAGISKAGIIEKLMTASAKAVPAAEHAAEPAAPAPVAAAESPAPVMPPVVKRTEPVRTPVSAPAFTSQPSYSQPAAAPKGPNPNLHYSAKPAYQAPAYPARSTWSARPAAAQQPVGTASDGQRMQMPRPVSYTSRFGPGSHPSDQDPGRRFGMNRPEAVRPAYASQPAVSAVSPVAPVPASQDTSGFVQDRIPMRSDYPRNDFRDSASLTVNDLLDPGECEEGSGTLEMHPDGYGFLRGKTFLPSARDIYISIAQVRRFGLRTGDYITGRIRPQRDGDKYAAMLYVTSVNGTHVDEIGKRYYFDEMTPVYPTRRFDLDCHSGEKYNDMRLTDLLAPLGFGQRALVLCPPNTGKTDLLVHFAKVIHENHPYTEVMVLLLNDTPEDVTIFRDQVDCTVYAATFDQPPEAHLRLTDMVLEHAEREVELQRDVVIIVDSLTHLAKTYTTASAQQGRAIPGMVNPTSLFRAKKLFGAARSMKEGGSLTVIGTMDVSTGSKVDESVVEEFRGSANMELTLDQSVAAAGVSPAFNPEKCGTRHAELLLNPEELEGLQLTRRILNETTSAVAIPQLLQMMDTTDSNAVFLTRVQTWAAMLGKTNK